MNRRLWLCVLAGIACAIFFHLVDHAWPKDDGRFAGSPLKPWFDKLASGKGLCCSFADGVSVRDVDWDTGGQNKDTQNEGGQYRVRVCAKPPAEPGPGAWADCKQKTWVVVPDAALVTEPNKFGPAVVWPYADSNGAVQIRCFIPGAGA